jgi:hypothetical protein
MRLFFNNKLQQHKFNAEKDPSSFLSDCQDIAVERAI